MYQETDLIKHQRVTAMAAQYDKAIEEIEQAKSLLLSAGDRMKSEFGRGAILSSIEYDIERSLKEMKPLAWRYILTQSQITSFLSIKRKKELDKQIEEDKLPDITEENIISTLQSFIEDSSTLLNETVKEVFDWLIPYWRDDFKTNKKYQVGKKVIKDWMVEHSWGNCFHIRYGSEDQLTALDNAFHLMDGKGVPRHPDNLVCQINTAMKESTIDESLYKKNADTFENDMYKIKWYLKGTMHIEFKRLDLLKKLNKIGSDGAQVIGDREYSREEQGLAVV